MGFGIWDWNGNGIWDLSGITEVGVGGNGIWVGWDFRVWDMGGKYRLTTLVGDKRVLLEVIWFPASENKRSLGTEVAGIDKYLRAILLKIGKEC